MAKIRKIVLLSNTEERELISVINLLKNKYTVKFETSVDSAVDYIEKKSDDIASVIIYKPSEIDNIKKLLDYMNESNTVIFAIPALVMTTEKTMKDDETFLGDPVIDIFDINTSEELLINKIERASQFLNSVSFSEFANMLRVLPSLIYLKDARGRYVFSSQYWHHLEHYDDPDWTIRGKTDMEIRKDTENAKKAYESDLQMIKDGNGRSYIIEVNEDGQHEFLQIIKEPLKYEDGRIRGIIALINNVTEQEELKRQLEKLSYTDNLTGIYNRAFFDNYITKITEDLLPLGIISGDCDNLKKINDRYGHMVGDEYIRMSVTLIKTILPEETIICRTGGDEFVVFLPGVEDDTVRRYVNILNGMDDVFSIMDQKLAMSFGAHTMTSLEEDIRACIATSDAEMYNCKKRKKQLYG
ncbi:diguanylate cyclase (GGDEF) domain-containing protein [Lachnospiraceae bacterium]|nr:diguanylate cyclase (GGDEF) domain-containing protein [Lachnospiraceae bacterium]